MSHEPCHPTNTTLKVSQSIQTNQKCQPTNSRKNTNDIKKYSAKNNPSDYPGIPSGTTL